MPLYAPDMRFLCVTLALCSSLAVAQDETPPTERRQATEYIQRVHEGLTQMAAGDVVGAMATFHEAIRQDAAQAAAHCHLASAQRQNGDATTALSSFQSCAQRARQSSDVINEARALIGVASILVLDRQRREEARGAVRELVRFAEQNGSAYPLEMARSLQQTLDQIIELDAVAAEVQRKREERARNAE